MPLFLKIGFIMNRMINQIKIFLLLILVSGIHSCKEEFSPFVTGLELNSIGEYLNQNHEEYSYFMQLIEGNDLADALNSYNPYGNDYTLFLPTNSAFDRFFTKSNEYKNIDELLSDNVFSNELVKYHILNTGIRSNDFPFGAFSDTTLSGDLLSVGFLSGADSTLFLINNTAQIKTRDIEARNGFIHVLTEVLSPVVFTGYEWLKDNSDFSIITEVFELTGVKDLMGLTIQNSAGNIVLNKYTLFVEPDSIFHKDGIFSTQDLIQRVSNSQDDYTTDTNPLYQFAAYHIMEDILFLDDFEENKNYNTFSALPIKITADTKVKINNDPKFHVFDTIILGRDTTYINYLEPLYNVSNTLTKNGAIHLLNNILFPYKPQSSFLAFGFLNDTYIKELSRKNGTFILNENSPLDLISWEGPEEIIYYKTSSSGEKALNKDYLRIEGDFVITYQIPRIYPGAYKVTINGNSNFSGNAIIEVFIDGKRIGGNVNFTSGANSTVVYREALLGRVEYTDYVSHTVTIKSVLPGRLTWDYIKFSPN
jgi:uncharacterized surface protein with fasciclin (FAS1) repeats